ncbi:hypothetical protein LCGC14_2589550 [marine sediment metagenome]|uniref:Uncharacterized protein n=1 Tax=marine sediment metagenome TaxID=412755 RepID=A0A0F9ABZ3_9ZZZZ
MADFGVFTKNADIQAEAGINANSTSKATAATDVYVLNVEATINAMTRRNWSDDFAGLNADVRNILIETGACMCANKVIKADMSGFTSRGEAESMITVNRDTFLRNISILRDKKVETFIDGET